jgi:hypothetical protein
MSNDTYAPLPLSSPLTRIIGNLLLKIAINGFMEVFSYGKKKNNDLLVISNLYVKYKELDIWTSVPFMTNKYVKCEDFVINSIYDIERKTFWHSRPLWPLT